MPSTNLGSESPGTRRDRAEAILEGKTTMVIAGEPRDDTPLADGVHFGETPADTVTAVDGEPVGDSDRGTAGESAGEQVPALRPLTEPADDDDEAGEPYER